MKSTAPDTLPPVRGLVLTHNKQGMPFSLTDQKKWIRLCGTVFKCPKIDLHVNNEDIRNLYDIQGFARNESIALSLRIQEQTLLDNIQALSNIGLHDVMLCVADIDLQRLKMCLDALESAGLPVRLQITPPPSCTPTPSLLAEHLSRAASVNVVLTDPFLYTPAQPPYPQSQHTVQWMNQFIRELDRVNVEANLLNLPYCHIEEDNYPHALSQRVFFLDHQQYLQSAYELAIKLFNGSPHRMGKVLENLLSRRNSLLDVVDNALFPWLLQHPRLHIRLWMLHKLTRHLRFLRRSNPLPENVAAYEAALASLEKKHLKTMAPECRPCRFQCICDQETELFKCLLPGLRIRAVGGKPIAPATQSAAERKRYYDSVDEARRRLPQYWESLARTARNITLHQPPAREISVDDYAIENHYNPRDDAAKRWYSLSRGELTSTVLARLKPPFTLMLTFGGGIAEQVGFSFGRHAKVVCPMIDYSHQITFHVDADGYFVLLRDGMPVRPTEFEGIAEVPHRLSGVLEPRISIHNIDGFILTQTLMVWEAAPALSHATPSSPIFSVIIVSTRYTRRLQAVLLALAHQQGIDFSSLEVVVAYVPGIDATDDLMDSMEKTHPHLRMVRSTFAKEYEHSKGFMINESVHVASGEWIVLMDSDIIVPPDMFSRMNSVRETAHFMAPEGRKMLTPDMTAKILLGELRSWEDFHDIANATAEYRFMEGDGLPCGFFQCVRREILEKTPYRELNHFEGADHAFARNAIQEYGAETRLKEVIVLHLDHGGRQWYGTWKHR